MSANEVLKANREAKQRKRHRERKLTAWMFAVPSKRGARPFLGCVSQKVAAIAVLATACLLFATPALALDQLEAPKPIPAPCACGDLCPCDIATCQCPKLVTFQNGDKALWIPAPVNVKERWPFQGPFLWTGQAGRWVLGAPRRGR